MGMNTEERTLSDKHRRLVLETRIEKERIRKLEHPNIGELTARRLDWSIGPDRN